MRTALAASALMVVPLVLLTAAPVAHAADANHALTIESVAILNEPIAFEGTANTTVTIGVGCAQVLRTAAASQGKAPVTLLANDTAPWLTVSVPTPLEINPADCVSQGNPAGSGYLTRAIPVVLRVAAEAPGVIVHRMNFSASMANAGSATASVAPESELSFTVAYNVNYTIEPSIDFPATVTGRYLNFTVKVTQVANAPGMVMIDSLRAVDKDGKGQGTVSGLAAADYTPENNTRDFRVSFMGPSAKWNETTITFRAFSHYLFNATAVSGGDTPAQTYAWLVRNGNPDGSPDSKPAPVGGLPTMVLLAGLAILMRRKAPPSP